MENELASLALEHRQCKYFEVPYLELVLENVDLTINIRSNLLTLEPR